MILFRKIKWKNLLSTGNVFNEVILNKSSTTLVCGENGAGKTTLLDALTFVLYGKPFRNINIPLIVNSINGRDCIVEIEFIINNNEYRVVRGLAPKVFDIEKNGVLIDHATNVKDYQSLLENQILKMNFKTFCQVVILGSTNYVPFMRLPAADRRNIVENLLDIDVFSKMNEALKSRMSCTKEELGGIEREISTLKLRIEHKKDMISKIETKSETQLDGYKKTEEGEQIILRDLLEKTLGLEKELNEIDVSKENIEKKRDSLNQFSVLRKQMNNGINKAVEEKTFYQDNEDCPVCKNDLPKDFRESMITKKNSRQGELESALSKMDEMIAKEKTSLDSMLQKMEVLEKKKSEIRKVESEISSSKKYLKQLLELINGVKREKESLQSERDAMTSLQQEESSAESRMKEFVEDMHTMDVATMLLKDSGIKRKIIRKYIPALNRIINKYLISMDFFAQFTLNEDFNEIIKSRHRDEFSYENFSEGEKLRIDLSLLLAWRDIARMKNCANTNLLILDEIFDSSLDSLGTEEVIKILQGMGGSNNIFVISHKSDQLLDKFHNILSFRKVNNFSKLC